MRNNYFPKTIAFIFAMFFLTSLGLSQIPTVEIGEGSLLDTGLPITVTSAYSYSQSIFLKEEINIEGQRIAKIAYYHNGGNQWSNPVAIYMAHTTQENLTAYVTEGLTEVFNGQLFAINEPGWLEITLTTPFEYNNVDNLLIAIKEDGAGSQRESHFMASAVTGNKSIVRSKATSPAYDITNPPTNGILLEARPNIRFWFEEIPQAANMSIFPSQLYYQFIRANESKSLNVVLRNTGTENLEVTGFNSSGLPFTSSFTGTIAPGAEAQTTIIFSPTAAGVYEGDVSFTSNAGNLPLLYLSANAVHSNAVIQIFESTDFPPEGWYLDPTSWTRRATVAGGYVGPASAWKGSTAGPGYLASPKINIQQGDVLTFYAYSFQGGQLTVSYSADLVTWTELIIPELTGAYQRYTINLDAAAGANYIGFSGTAQLFLDYIITPPIHQETPPQPSAGEFPSNDSEDTFLTQFLNWGQSNLADGYKIYLGTDNPPTSIINGQDLGTSRTFKTPALQYNTTYYWQIVPYNSYGDATDCPIWSFSTIEHMPNSEFPFSEGFEANSGQVPPAGWINDDGKWQTTVNANSGSFGARAPWNHNAELITPPMQLPTVAHEMVFYWKNGYIGSKEDKAIGYDTLYVEVSSDLGQSWQIAKFLSAESYMTEFVPVNVDLEDFAGQEVHIRFRQSTNANYQGALSVAIDDIEIKTTLQEPLIWINDLQWTAPTIANNTYKKSGTFSIRNMGAGTLTVSEAFFQGDYFTTSFNKDDVALEFGEQYDFTFSFEPFEAGDFDAVFNIQSNGGNIEFALTGQSLFVPPFSYEYFETTNFPPLGWMMVDADGDGYNWMIGYHPTVPAHKGIYSAISMSFIIMQGDLTPDNWLITPKIHVGENQEFSFWVANDKADKPYEAYKVYLSTTTNRIDQFDVLLWEEILQPHNYAYEERVFDLTQYEGQEIYIAFRHTDCTGQYQMKIDDLSLRTIQEVEAPYADPAQGDVFVGTEVSLFSETDDADIFFTLDGNTPDSDSQLFTEPIVIQQAVTIKAIARKNGKYSEVATFDYTINSTGVNQLSQIPLKVYPNPAKDFIVIKKGSDQQAGITVFDVSGKIVIESVMNSEIGLDISSLKAGFYIVKVTEKESVRQTRFIVQ